MACTDYYRVLGVAKDATRAEIRSAYHMLARKYHPDLNPDDAQAESRLKQINEAYEVLGDLEKRARYDRQREANRRVGQQTKAQPTSNQWNDYSSRPVEQPVNIEWIAATTSATLAILLVVGSLLSTSLAPFFVAAILAGGVLAVGWEIHQNDQIRCPNCNQSKFAEESPREMLGIFKKSAEPLWGSRQKDGVVISHVKYRLHCQCRTCGYRWIATKTERL